MKYGQLARVAVVSAAARLHLEGLDATPEGHRTQCAPDATRESRAVEEDAPAPVAAGTQRRLVVELASSMYPFIPRPCFMNCQPSGLSSFTDSRNLATSSSPVKNAPCEQQPSSGRPATMPWQPGVPNTQVQRERSHVISAAIRCSALSGSRNSTHSRAKSSPNSGLGVILRARPALPAVTNARGSRPT